MFLCPKAKCFCTAASSMLSAGQKIFINLRKLSKSKVLWATGIATSIGAGIYYIDKSNIQRFNKGMVVNLIINIKNYFI